jgi:hypothetical protein
MACQEFGVTFDDEGTAAEMHSLSLDDRLNSARSRGESMDWIEAQAQQEQQQHGQSEHCTSSLDAQFDEPPPRQHAAHAVPYGTHHDLEERAPPRPQTAHMFNVVLKDLPRELENELALKRVLRECDVGDLASLRYVINREGAAAAHAPPLAAIVFKNVSLSPEVAIHRLRQAGLVAEPLSAAGLCATLQGLPTTALSANGGVGRPLPRASLRGGGWDVPATKHSTGVADAPGTRNPLTWEKAQSPHSRPASTERAMSPGRKQRVSLVTPGWHPTMDRQGEQAPGSHNPLTWEKLPDGATPYAASASAQRYKGSAEPEPPCPYASHSQGFGRTKRASIGTPAMAATHFHR